MAPKLSIITPSLNQGAFLERTITSVLDQGYEDLEYLVADGGSDDGSVEIIRRYEERLAWWVSEADEGQTHAINKGLLRATGEVVAYINSDDYYLPGAFEAAIEALEESGARWVAGAARVVDEGDHLVHVWRPEPPAATEKLIKGRHWWMLSPWGVPQPSVFWRRDLFEEFGHFRRDMDYAFDTEFFLRLAYGGVLPAMIDRELSARVLHAEAKSADRSPFRREVRRYPRIFKGSLNPSERRRLALTQALFKIGLFRAIGLAGRLRARLSGRSKDPARPHLVSGRRGEAK